MIQALNNSIQYSSKTDEIMSRYRPIAPKPADSATNGDTSNGYDNGPLVPEKFRQSPYLRNMWSHLQARPTRTRKRARNSPIAPAAAAAILRKQKQQSLASNIGKRATTTSSRRSLSIQAFEHHQNNKNNVVVELPLLPWPNNSKEAIDLNMVSLETASHEERDLQLRLQVSNSKTHHVISPRPVRPIGSSICIIGPIISDNPTARVIVNEPEEIEAAAEAEVLPAVISNRSNKVRMVNSAYKELIGQPECSWLDSMCFGGRISGEVMLHLFETRVPLSSNGFSCWVKIEWESNAKKNKKNSVNAFCDVVKMVCMSKDYVYYWRFHTLEGSKV